MAPLVLTSALCAFGHKWLTRYLLLLRGMDTDRHTQFAGFAYSLMPFVRLPMLTKPASITSPGREQPADATATRKPAAPKKSPG